MRGAAAMTVAGTGNSISASQARLFTDHHALVVPIDNIEGTTGIRRALGQPRLQLGVIGKHTQVFIGVGPTSAVERYLAGAAIDLVTDLELSAFTFVPQLRDGAARPGRPEAQPFWVTTAVGSDPTIDWKIRDGSYRLVIMNADASPGVVFGARFRVVVPHLFRTGIGILIAGVGGHPDRAAVARTRGAHVTPRRLH